jgi:hypothetical protein
LGAQFHRALNKSQSNPESSKTPDQKQMKTKVALSVVLASALGAFAQGTVNYNTRVVGIIVAPVYAPEPGNTSLSKSGNTSAGVPTGTQTYGGALLVGSGFSAQLFYANGPGQTEGSLTAAPLSLTTFRTSATLAGTIAPSFQSLAGVAVGGTATLQLRVWDNLGGTITSWTAAQSLWNSGSNPNYAIGKSGLFDVANLTDNSNPAPPEMLGLRSFNVFTSVPEPSTFVLAGLGAAGLLIFRRRK